MTLKSSNNRPVYAGLILCIKGFLNVMIVSEKSPLLILFISSCGSLGHLKNRIMVTRSF